MHLVIDNPRLPCDLPDLYEGFEQHREPRFDAFVRLGSRLCPVLFWIAVGVCVGVVL